MLCSQSLLRLTELELLVEVFQAEFWKNANKMMQRFRVFLTDEASYTSSVELEQADTEDTACVILSDSVE